MADRQHRDTVLKAPRYKPCTDKNCKIPWAHAEHTTQQPIPARVSHPAGQVYQPSTESTQSFCGPVHMQPATPGTQRPMYILVGRTY